MTIKNRKNTHTPSKDLRPIEISTKRANRYKKGMKLSKIPGFKYIFKHLFSPKTSTGSPIPINKSLGTYENQVFAKSSGVDGFIECNAKTGENIEEMFEALTRLMILKLHFKRNLKKKNKENSIKATEVRYTAKDLVDNLNISLRTGSDSIYPVKADKIYKIIYKINELVDLRLINNRTYIYINNKQFIQCIRLLLQIPHKESNLYEEIESIDEAAEIYKHSIGEFKNRSITPKQEFWGHCSVRHEAE